MFISPNKAQAMARDLQVRLLQRISSVTTSGRLNTCTTSFDSNGYPILTLSHGGTLGTTNPNLIIYISPVNAVSTDIFGNTIFAAAPHLTQVGFELGASANTLYVNLFDLALVCFEMIPLGTQVQLVESVHGSTVTTTTMATAVAAGNYQFFDWLQWPTKSV